MAPAIKFLHAADWHLDRVLDGLPEVPPHLKSLLAGAAYQAAENFFALALAERVDFVLLAGDIVDLEQGGPRAATFLQSQFQRLAERNIQVYWCSGSVDPVERWPAAASLPENVVLIGSTAFERHLVTKNSKPIATIFGAGRGALRSDWSDLHLAIDEVFPIVLAHAPSEEPSESLPLPVRYWALGGDHTRRVHERSGSTVVYPGTLQARSPDEVGRHGCVLVHLDPTGRIRVEPQNVDIIRWLPQHVSFAASASDDEIRSLFADRALQVLGEVPEQLGLVTWTVETTGEFPRRLQRETWRNDLLKWLRAEFGSGSKGLWSVDVQLTGERSLPREWFEEDTMLGDYLQIVEGMQADPDLPINLHAYLPPIGADDRLAAIARLEGSVRELVLRQVAMVGVERLGGWSEDNES